MKLKATTVPGLLTNLWYLINQRLGDVYAHLDENNEKGKDKMTI